ncbi:hypothetical protein L7F22_009796 [Adiantum nelumboides]|nr:hypothetical protein [Adiantum nelumboides]MCO5556250.1 hypothetical protein [Adiantum nelumboides]
MAIARTGVYVDDYLEYSSSLPAELQRLLSTMRELDERSQTMISQTKEQTNYCLSFPSQHSKKATPEQEELVDKLRKEIDTNQENALSLCTEKVLLAQQACDLVCSMAQLSLYGLLIEALVVHFESVLLASSSMHCDLR